MDAPAEVGDFYFTVNTNQDILWLDVSMHDVFFVKVSKSGGHLGDILGGFPFREFDFAAKVFVKLTLAGKLEDEEYSFAVMKMTVKAKYVWMA